MKFRVQGFVFLAEGLGFLSLSIVFRVEKFRVCGLVLRVSC